MGMQETHGGITRRSFVGASAAAMASLALVGCQPENKLEKTEQEPASAGVDREFDPTVEGRWVPASCNNNCGGMCENKVYVVDGVVVRQKTDDVTADSMASPQLRACPRGRAHRQDTFGADRLKYPMKRTHWEPFTGGQKELRGIDEWERIGWDEAIGFIADEITHTIETYGNEAMVVAGTGFGSPISKVLHTLGGWIPCSGTLSWGTTCYNAAACGLPYIGIGEENDRTDFVNADHIVLYGMNMAVASPGTYTYYFNEAKKGGTEFVFVGPEYNATAAHFNAKWIRVRPGTDTAFLLAVAYEMLKADEAEKGSVVDWDFLDTYCVGFDADHMPADAALDENFHDYLMGKYDGVEKTAEWATEICGTPVEDIRWYANLMGRDNVVTTLRSYAPARTNDSDHFSILYMTIGFMGNHIGRPGQCTGVAYHNTVGSCSQAIFNSGGAGTSAVPNPITAVINDWELWDAILTGTFNDTGASMTGGCGPQNIKSADIHMLAMVSSSSMNTTPNSTRAVEAVRSLDFVFATARSFTVQAQHADIVLPVMTEWEFWGTVKAGAPPALQNREAFIVGTRVCEPMFESKTEEEMGMLLSDKLGLDTKQLYPIDEKQQFFNKLVGSTMLTEDTHEVVPLFTITQEDIDSMEVDGTPQEGVYPLAKIFEEGIYKVSRKAGDGYTYYQYSDYLADPVANPRLTPSGKFEIYCQTRADALNATGRTEGYTWKPYPSYKTPVNGYEATFSDWENKVKGDYPYQIFNPHYLRRSHTQFDNLPWLRHAFPNPVCINAADAAEKGITQGDVVRIWNDAGQTLRPVEVTERLMPGVIALPHGPWLDIDKDTGIDRAGNENVLVPAVTSGQGVDGYNTVVVNFEKYDGTLEEDYLLPMRAPGIEE